MVNESQYTDKHYDFYYTMTLDESSSRMMKMDPYKVASVWKLGEKDNSGCLFHILKTIARFGEKNSTSREIKSIHATILRMAEIEGVCLEDLGV